MRTDWRLVGLLFVAGLLAAAQFAKVTLTLGSLAALYPGAPVTLAVGAVSLTGAVLGVMAGALVARLGARRMILAALALAAATSAFQAMLPGFGLFMASRVVEGAAHLVLVVAAPTLMAASASGRDRPVVMGLWGTFFGVGFALGAAVVPRILATGGVAAVFAWHAVASAAVLIALAPLLPRTPGPRPPLPRPLEEHRAIYGSARLSAPALGFFWHTLLFVPILTFLPAVLGGAIGAPWIGPALPIGALCGTFAAGVLSRRIAPERIAMAGFAITPAAFLLLALASDALQPGLALIALAAVGLVPGACFASVPALNATPAAQARANGAIAQLGNVGTASGTPIFVAVIAVGGEGGLHVLTGLCSLAGLACLLMAHAHIRPA